jgi:hypothetical protein
VAKNAMLRFVARVLIAHKAVHEAVEWQAAMEALILVATLGGPTMFARIGVMRALNRNACSTPVAQGQALGTPEAGAGSVSLLHIF